MASAVQIIISAKDLASMTLRNFQGTINRTVRSVERFASTANYVALRAGIALAGIGMGAKHLLTVASESEELDNVMQESFEHMRDSVESWAISTAQAMNRSTYQMREFVGLNQALLRPMIGDIAKATEMSKTLATLAVDMASFWNVEDKEVFEALQSGIVGLVRPLRRFGIDLTEAALKQYALNKGIKEAIEEMDQAKKALLRYDFIIERTAIQQGDAVRTAGSYQNQLKGLQGEIRNLTEEMGKLLLPMGAEVLRNVRDLVKWFRDLDTETKTQIVRWAAMGSAVLGGVVAFGMVVTAINVVVKGFATLASLIGIFTSPMVLGIGLLTAAVAGLYTAWEKDWGGIRSLIEDILTYLDELKKKITDSKAWKWTVDVAIPAIAEGAQMVINAVVEVTGKMYEAIKKGFATGDWSDFWLITADTWRKGVLIGVALSGAVQGINIVKDAIIKGLGLVTTALGVPGALGAISVLIQLKEAMVLTEQGMGSAYEDFARNVLIAALAGVLTGLAFDAKLGMWAFTIAVNLKLGNVFETSLQSLGEKVSDWFLQKEADKTGIPFDVLKQKEKIIDEYVQYREAWYKEATKDMGWLEAFLFRAKTIHEGLMNLEEWLQEVYGMTFEQFMNFGKPQPGQKGWGDFLRETRGYHEGGILPGKSGPDQFLAMVAPGEAIVPSKVVNAGWRAVLNWFRQKGVPGFQSGYVPNIRTGNAEFDANLRSTSDWIRNLSEGLNDIFRVIKDGFVNFFSFIGEFLIRLAEKFFPEQVKDLREFWSNLVERWNKIINAKPFEAEPGKRPEEQVIVDTRTAWQRMIDTLSADWKKVIELYNKVAIRYDILRKWLQKSWEEKLDDMKEIFAKAVLGFRDVAINVVQNLDDLIISKSPILSGIMSAKERGFEEGGTWGAVSAVVLTLINHSQAFANLMGIINPLMQAFADMIGALLSPLLPLVVVISTTITPIFKVLGAILSALMPVFELLFPVFKSLGIVVLGVANTIANVWNMLVGIIDAIPFVNMSRYYIDTQGLSDAMKELSALTWEEAMARAVNTDKIKEATEAMRNVPSGFKVALRRFEATIPQGMSASSATLTNAIVNNKSEEIHIHIEGDVYGVQDLDRKIEEAIAKARRKQGLAAHGLTGAKAGAY